MSQPNTYPANVPSLDNRIPTEVRRAIEARLAEMAKDFGTTTEEITLVALCMFLFGAPTEALARSMMQNNQDRA